MSLFQKTKPIKKTNKHNSGPTPRTHDTTSPQQSDEEDYQSKAIVEAIFTQKKQQDLYQHSMNCWPQDEDEDIKQFLEEQIPGLYQQEQENINIGNNIGAQIPQYFSMSKNQKENYFDGLNSLYMTRIGATTINIQPNLKPSIRFSEVVREVAFDKNQQPIVVGRTQEEFGYLSHQKKQQETDEFREQEHSQDEEVQKDVLGRIYRQLRQPFYDDQSQSLDCF